MKLIIEHLGPIRRGEIDLSKKFFVFVGHNNSGKTYVSQLLWTIFNHDVIYSFAEKSKIEELFFNRSEFSTKFVLNEKIIDSLLEKFTEYLIEKAIPQNNRFQLTNKFKLRFEYDLNKFKNQETVDVALKADNKTVGRLSIEKNSLDIICEIQESAKETTNINSRFLTTNLIYLSLIALFNNIHESFFLPASRAFFPAFYRYIYEIERQESKKRDTQISKLLDSKVNSFTDYYKELEKIRATTHRPYNEPMNALFEHIFKLNNGVQERKSYNDSLQELSKVMGGDIQRNSLEGIAPIDFRFQVKDKDVNLPMFLSSSSVNQLSTLYLYLKYWVEDSNNFLFIDEPEENLYLDNQLALLDILIQFATKNNNKVLITTHSPLLAEAVNNYLYLSVLKENKDVNIHDILEEHKLKNINPDITLTKEDTGVYFFNKRDIIPLDEGGNGVYFRDFHRIINEVNETGKILTDYIYLKEHSHEDISGQ